MRPLQLSDAEDADRLFPHWDIVKFLNAVVPWPFPENQVFPHYRDVILPAIERGEEWHWSLRLKESPEHLIGKISLHRDEWGQPRLLARTAVAWPRVDDSGRGGCQRLLVRCHWFRSNGHHRCFLCCALDRLFSEHAATAGGLGQRHDNLFVFGCRLACIRRVAAFARLTRKCQNAIAVVAVGTLSCPPEKTCNSAWHCGLRAHA